MAPSKILRGDIFEVRLDPVEGHEQEKTRPDRCPPRVCPSASSGPVPRMSSRGRVESYAVDPHRLRDVLERALSDVLILQRQASAG